MPTASNKMMPGVSWLPCNLPGLTRPFRGSRLSKVTPQNGLDHHLLPASSKQHGRNHTSLQGSSRMSPVTQVAELTTSAAGGVRLILAGQLAGARVALAFSRFVPTASDGPLGSAADAAAPQAVAWMQRRLRPACAFSSGRMLSEETRYCLERRQLEQQVGVFFQEGVTACFYCSISSCRFTYSGTVRSTATWVEVNQVLVASHGDVHLEKPSRNHRESHWHYRARSAPATSAHCRRCWCTPGQSGRHRRRSGVWLWPLVCRCI